MNIIKKIWRGLREPTARYATGTLLVFGFVAGVIFWGGFNWALEASNSMSFCISCHEMRSTVYEELKKTVHFENPSGVTATCADCHVPEQWHYKVVRKIQATFNELPKHLVGYINTPEEFEEHRLELAKRVWTRMEEDDSRNCRNCHAMTSMALAAQAPRARGQHEDAVKDGDTCIDCHKGIAHKPVHKELEQPKDEGGFMLE